MSEQAEKRGRGRPATGRALSDAARAQAYRERKTQSAEAERRELFTALMHAYNLMTEKQRTAWERDAPEVVRRVAAAVEQGETEAQKGLAAEQRTRGA